MIIKQTKDLSGRAVTPKQLEALQAVVRTNGGGVSVYRFGIPFWQGLINRGLVQGKLNASGAVVHTKAGLEYIRSLNPHSGAPNEQ